MPDKVVVEWLNKIGYLTNYMIDASWSGALPRAPSGALHPDPAGAEFRTVPKTPVFYILFLEDMMSDEVVFERLTEMGYLTNYMTGEKVPIQRHKRSSSISNYEEKNANIHQII